MQELLKSLASASPLLDKKKKSFVVRMIDSGKFSFKQKLGLGVFIESANQELFDVMRLQLKMAGFSGGKEELAKHGKFLDELEVRYTTSNAKKN